MHRSFLLVLGLLFPLTMWAQTPCPSIDFVPFTTALSCQNTGNEFRKIHIENLEKIEDLFEEEMNTVYKDRQGSPQEILKKVKALDKENADCHNQLCTLMIQQCGKVENTTADFSSTLTICNNYKNLIRKVNRSIIASVVNQNQAQKERSLIRVAHQKSITLSNTLGLDIMRYAIDQISEIIQKVTYLLDLSKRI